MRDFLDRMPYYFMQGLMFLAVIPIMLAMFPIAILGKIFDKYL